MQEGESRKGCMFGCCVTCFYYEYPSLVTEPNLSDFSVHKSENLIILPCQILG